MNSDTNRVDASTTPRLITHTTVLPCHACGTLTTTSRVEPRDEQGWTLIPLCAAHLPCELNGTAN